MTRLSTGRSGFESPSPHQRLTGSYPAAICIGNCDACFGRQSRHQDCYPAKVAPDPWRTCSRVARLSVKHFQRRLDKALHFWQRILATGVDEIAGPRSCCFDSHCGRTRTSFRYARFLVAGLTSRLLSVIAVLLAMLVTHDPEQTSCRPQVSYRDIPRSSDGWVACRQRLHDFA